METERRHITLVECLRDLGGGIALLSVLMISVLMLSQVPQIAAQRQQPQTVSPESDTSAATWLSWAATAWSYFAPGVGVNPTTGLHMANLEFPCFTMWDEGAYILSIIYAYKLGLITSGGTCTGTQSNTWEFDCRIQKIMLFLMNQPLISGNTPYEFYSSTNINPYTQCPSTTQNEATDATDIGRLLGALSILETITPTYDSDVNTIITRTQSTYSEFASTCCNGADYYAYMIAEGFYAFQSTLGSCCGVFAAVADYSGPTYTLDGYNLPEINSDAEPLNLEILLGQQHSTNPQFLNFANLVYMVQDYNYTQTGNLAAWTEGDYPPNNYPNAYVDEWVLVDLSGVWQTWQLTGFSGTSSLVPEGAPGGPPVGSPPLAYTKTAFSYLAIYGANAYTDALVNAASQLATSQGFGEATLQNGQSALSLWSQTGDQNSFYTDKTQEQVLEAAFYAITQSPTFLSFGSQISSVVSAGAGSVWFVLPDFTAGEAGSMHTSASKCGGHVAALATDVYAATYLFGALAAPQQNEVLDTNSAYISQSGASCGDPTTPIDQPLLAVAGSAVNEVVGYYETVQATSPLYYGTSGSQAGCIVNRASGTSLDCSTPTATNDVFIMEAFTDQAGRTVYIIYGRQWGGTLAGFEYLVNFVLKNPSTYTASWYVYRWQDASSGVSANSIPDPGDTYTQIATGP